MLGATPSKIGGETRGQEKMVRHLFNAARTVSGGIQVVEAVIVLRKIFFQGASGENVPQDHSREESFIRRLVTERDSVK